MIAELRTKLRNIRPVAPKGIFRNLMIFLSILGPGVITANVDNDAGGIATYSLAGAHYGYAFVWSVIPIVFVLVVVQEMNLRMGAVTGKGLTDLIRENFGVKVTFYLMHALLLTNLANTMSEFAGVAASLEIFGIPKYFSVPPAALFVWFLVVKGNYQSVEKVFLVACLFYISYIISGFLAKPEWPQVWHAATVPHMEWNASYLYMLIGLIGTTIAPWMQFYMQASVVEKGIDAATYHQSRWDVWIGCIMAGLVVFFIIIACGATIFPSHQHVETAADAALALQPLAGKYCSWLFAFGLFNASLFAASVLPLSTSYYVCEGLGFEAGINKTMKEAPQFYTLYTTIIVIGASVVLIPQFPLLKIMIFSQVLNGMLLPLTLLFMILLINRRDLMGDFVNGKVWNVVCWVTVVTLVILTLMMLGLML